MTLTLNEMKSPFPNCELNADKWRSHEQRVDAFTAQEDFRQSQKVKLNAEVEKIYQNKNFSDEEKLKKSTAASSRLLKAEVRKFATLQGFPVLHFMPYLMAQLMFCAVCFLHLDCNEWKRVFDRLLSTSCDATLEEFPDCPKFPKYLNVGKKSANTVGTWHPHLAHLNSDSSLRRLYARLKNKMQMTSLSRAMVMQYTPPITINLPKMKLKTQKSLRSASFTGVM